MIIYNDECSLKTLIKRSYFINLGIFLIRELYAVGVILTYNPPWCACIKLLLQKQIHRYIFSPSKETPHIITRFFVQGDSIKKISRRLRKGNFSMHKYLVGFFFACNKAPSPHTCQDKKDVWHSGIII